MADFVAKVVGDRDSGRGAITHLGPHHRDHPAQSFQEVLRQGASRTVPSKLLDFGAGAQFPQTRGQVAAPSSHDRFLRRAHLHLGSFTVPSLIIVTLAPAAQRHSQRGRHFYVGSVEG